MKAIIQKFFAKKRKLREENHSDKDDSFFPNDDFIKKSNFKNVVKRIVKNRKIYLTPYPLGFMDISWLANNHEKEFKNLLLERYKPNEKITFNMPKKNFTFRPVSYLQPIDSIIYQALVDKVIKHKRKKFSKSVYNHIINDIKKSDVFHNPVGHWLDMRDNIRAQYKQGFNYYMFSDISGYFENIKIKKLLEIFKFYVGREDSAYLDLLNKIVCKWQYAISQGLIQSHPASSILAKIYLTPMDSELGYLKSNYNRYVDEFHILAKTKPELMKISESLNEALRELGLNINVSKSKFLEKDEIIEDLNKEKDFFDGVNYLIQFGDNNEEAIEKIQERFNKLEEEYKETGELNLRIFRYCIKKFMRLKLPDAISFCVELLEKYPDQTVDIINYLNVFINDDSHRNVIAEIHDFIKDKEKNLYKWQQIWLLALIYEVDDKEKINFDLIWDIVNDKNQDALSRSICYLTLAKHLDDYDLITLKEHYDKANSLILKRTLLFCLSKLPTTFTKGLFEIDSDDDLNIVILKMFLQNNSIDFSSHRILVTN